MKILVNLICFLPILTCLSCSTYDLVLRNAELYDGLGNQPERGEIAIRNGKIARISSRISRKGHREIDVNGQALAPGFIDLHAHIAPLALYPDAKSHVMQGVTTVVGGPDGGSPLRIGPYLDSLSSTGIGINVAYLIGHNTIRNHILGLVDRDPTVTELKEMQNLVANAMVDGAFGISTGLKYLPGAYSELPEIFALAKTAAAYGGIYTSHLREEGLGLLEGVSEAIEIGRSANIRVVLTHHKAIGQKMWGASKRTLAMVDEARKEGLDIRMDQYPYTASHTGISVLIPAWAREGGQDQFAIRCADTITRRRILEETVEIMINDRGGNDLRRVQFSKIDWKEGYEGKTLHDLVVDEGLEPTIENGAKMVLDIQLHRGANCIYHVIDSADVVRIMQHPWTMIASDGTTTQFGNGHPHPRAYGTFPRVLGHYARDLKVITLPEAIRKMTHLPAETLGLSDRGSLKKGNWADLVIFDTSRIIDRATFTSPHAYPEGVKYVMINGIIAVDNGNFTGVMPGKVLKHQGR